MKLAERLLKKFNESFNLEDVADTISKDEIDFQDEDGMYDKEYIMDRFGLNKDQYKKLMTKLGESKNEAKDDVQSILTALNSTSGAGSDKFPFGNKELTNKAKYLEQSGKIVYDDKFGKWKKK